MFKLSMEFNPREHKHLLVVERIADGELRCGAWAYTADEAASILRGATESLRQGPEAEAEWVKAFAQLPRIRRRMSDTGALVAEISHDA